MSTTATHVWSHTSLNCFGTCPKQFYHRYILKDVKFEESAASRRGNDVHAAMEARLKIKTPLPEDMPYEQFAAALDERPLLVEEELGIRKDGDWATWWDAYVYGRGKPDVVIMPDAGDHAVILDWKTGKVREDPAELETFAVLINARYPLITQFTGYYVWLTTPVALGQKHTLDRKQKWTTIQSTATEISERQKRNDFPATPNGLCKAWCSVLSCPHNGRRTKSRRS